jgi:hypothetical protein
VARKEARKAVNRSKPDTLAQQNEKLRKTDGRLRNDEPFVTPKSKKGKQPQRDVDEYTEEKLDRASQAVEQYREKMLEKWGDSWTSTSRGSSWLNRRLLGHEPPGPARS